MTIDLLLAGAFHRDALAGVLADLAEVPVESVDVADIDAAERAWDSPVLCTYEATAGDVSWLLDIYLVVREPEAGVAAGRIANRLGIPVLWAAGEFPPSAFWLVTPDGLTTRARLYRVDDDGPVGRYQLDAVERPVAQFPSVRVEPLPEVIREHRVPTPVTDRLMAGLPDVDATVWQAANNLIVWEQVTERMAAGWPPDGWYPADFYHEDLAARDAVAAAIPDLPDALAERFRQAVAQIDDKFMSLTWENKVVPDGTGWWWRVPLEPGLGPPTGPAAG